MRKLATLVFVVGILFGTIRDANADTVIQNKTRGAIAIPAQYGGGLIPSQATFAVQDTVSNAQAAFGKPNQSQMTFTSFDGSYPNSVAIGQSLTSQQESIAYTTDNISCVIGTDAGTCQASFTTIFSGTPTCACNSSTAGVATAVTFTDAGFVTLSGSGTVSCICRGPK